MTKILKYILKYLILWTIFGTLYFAMECMWKGNSHWTMFILGGICGILLDLENEFLSWETPLWKQMLIGCGIITTLEFITGEILTRVFHLIIWDYSNLPFNIDGVICLPYSILWFFLSSVGIVLGDYLRYWIFKEEKPRYILF